MKNEVALVIVLSENYDQLYLQDLSTLQFDYSQNDVACLHIPYTLPVWRTTPAMVYSISVR